MKERVVLFHRKFANKKIALTTLQKLYAKNKIKFKAVRQRKGMPQSTLNTFEEKRQEILQKLKEETSSLY